MRFFCRVLANVMTFTLALIFIVNQANARTYLAVSSGNFSSGTTWDGIVPTDLVAGDEVIIPAGITVTMDQDVNMNGLLNLDAGVLSLNGYKLNFGTAGDLQVNGNGAIQSTPNSSISIATANGLTSNLTFI